MAFSTLSTEASSPSTGARDLNERRLRILVINWQDRLNAQAGGAEVHLHEIFGRLARSGHLVSLLVSGWKGGAEREVVDGMAVTRTGGRYSFPIHVQTAFRRLCAEHQYDVVVEDINKVPLFTPRWSNIPVVGLVPHLFGTTAFKQESWPIAATVWGAEKLMVPAYRHVPMQVISDSTADDLVARGFQRSQIQVIYPGLDHDLYQSAGDRVLPDVPTFVYVGRLKRYKGVDVLIRAVGLLRAQGRPVRLIIAGKGDDRPRLEKLTSSWELTESIEFAGFVSSERKVELLRSAWASLYPSPKEGWGIANIEAAACGTPSIASDSPGLRETVLDDETGFLVQHDSPSEWAARMIRLSEDHELRDRLGAGALRHASGFTWERAARETEASIVAAMNVRRAA